MAGGWFPRLRLPVQEERVGWNAASVHFVLKIKATQTLLYANDFFNKHILKDVDFHWECLTINACFPENSFHLVSGNSSCSEVTGSTASMSVIREKGVIAFVIHMKKLWRWWCKYKVCNGVHYFNWLPHGSLRNPCTDAAPLSPFKGCFWGNSQLTGEGVFFGFSSTALVHLIFVHFKLWTSSKLQLLHGEVTALSPSCSRIL